MVRMDRLIVNDQIHYQILLNAYYGPTIILIGGGSSRSGSRSRSCSGGGGGRILHNIKGYR